MLINVQVEKVSRPKTIHPERVIYVPICVERPKIDNFKKKGKKFDKKMTISQLIVKGGGSRAPGGGGELQELLKLKSFFLYVAPEIIPKYLIWQGNF